MQNLITEAEIFDIAFNRNITPNLIKPSQIKVAQSVWVSKFFFGNFYNQVLNNQVDYEEFIDDYLKPIIAWGVVYNNYEYIATQITDKGVIQMLSEGTASLVDRDSKLDGKLEIKRTVMELIKLAQMYAESERDEGNTLFLSYISSETQYDVINFFSNRPSFNQKPY